MLTDTLPTHGNLTRWVIPAGGDPSGTCTITGGTALKCSFGDLMTNEMRTVGVESTAAVDATACALITNTATVTGDNVLTRTDTGDQSCADVMVSKTPDGGT